MIWHTYHAVATDAPPITWYQSLAGRITATPRGVTLDLRSAPRRPEDVEDVSRVMRLATVEHERMAMR